MSGNCHIHPHKRTKRTVKVTEETSQDEESTSTGESMGEEGSTETDSDYEEDSKVLLKAFWNNEAAFERIRINLERQLMRVDVDYGDKITTAAFMDFVRRHTSLLADL